MYLERRCLALVSQVEVWAQMPPWSHPCSLPDPGNFSVPVYIRTCHRPSCIVEGSTSPWTAIELQGECCKGNLCNGGSLNVTAAAATPLQAPHTLALLLTTALLASALGGPLGFSR